MGDIKRWRTENFNLVKLPRRFNSWVANRPFDEYQADLFFFNVLRQLEKVPTGTANEPVDYSVGLLVVDTFSINIAVVTIVRQKRRRHGGALDTHMPRR